MVIIKLDNSFLLGSISMDSLMGSKGTRRYAKTKVRAVLIIKLDNSYLLGSTFVNSWIDQTNARRYAKTNCSRIR